MGRAEPGTPASHRGTSPTQLLEMLSDRFGAFSDGYRGCSRRPFPNELTRRSTSACSSSTIRIRAGVEILARRGSFSYGIRETLLPGDHCHSEGGAARNRLHTSRPGRRPKNLFRKRVRPLARKPRRRRDCAPIRQILRSAHRAMVRLDETGVRLPQNDTVRHFRIRVLLRIGDHLPGSRRSTVARNSATSSGFVR